MSYSIIFAEIGTIGFSTVTIKFLPKFQKQGRGNRFGFLGISMIAGAIGFLVTWVIIVLMRENVISNNLEKSPQFAQYFFLIIPLTLFQIYYTLFDFYNNALYRSSFGIFLRDFLQRLLFLVGILLVMLHFFNFEDYIYFYTVSICLPTVIMIGYLWWHKGLDLSINQSIIDKNLLGSMVSVAFFGLLNNSSHAAILQIDSIMVNRYLDSSAVGIYTICFFFGSLVLIPSKAFNRISPTVISNAFQNNDLAPIRDIYYKGCQSLFLIACLIVIGLAVNLENIFYIIPRSYETGKWVIIIIALANLIKMAGGSNDSIITFSKYYKLTTIFLILLVVLIVIFNIILIPVYGMNGAAIATLIAVIIHNTAKTIFIYKKFGLFPYNAQYVIVLALSIFIYLIVNVLPPFNHFLIEIAKDSFLSILLFTIIIWTFPMAHDLKKMSLEIVSGTLSFLQKKLK